MAQTANDSRRLIFIGGSPRSGTTLVQNMLDSHPLVLGGPEFLHLPDIIELRRKLHSSITRGWIDMFCSREDVDNHLVGSITKLFLSLSEKYQCEFYSEKTPENILVFEALMELFPEAHFIQVLRDPRAILSSMQQVKQRAIAKGLKPPSFTADKSKSIAYIKRCVDAGANACKQSPEKVLTVVYERLLENPEIEAKKICTHVGIEWDDRVLRPGDKKHLGAHAITKNSNEIWYDSKTYNRNITSHDSDKWKKELMLYQQLHVTMAFSGNKELRRSGYDFSISSLVQDRRALSKIYIYGLYALLTISKLAMTIIRKFPMFSFIKNGLLRVARFFKK